MVKTGEKKLPITARAVQFAKSQKKLWRSFGSALAGFLWHKRGKNTG